MKRLFYILAFGLCLLTPQSLIADHHSDTFIESLEEFETLDNYSGTQSIYGDFEIKHKSSRLFGEYRLGLWSTVINRDLFESDVKAPFQFYLDLNRDQKEFISIQVRGELIAIFNEGYYIKYDDLQISVDDLNPDDLERLQLVMPYITQMKNKWFLMPLVDQVNLKDQKDIRFLNEQTIANMLKGKGVKNTLTKICKKLVGVYQINNPLDDQSLKRIKIVIERLFNIQLFKMNVIEKGHNAGFTHFHLDKGNIIRMVQRLSKQIKEPLDNDQIKGLRQMMAKVQLSGIYHIDDIWGISDHFLVKWTIRNTHNIKRFNLNYRMVVERVNQEVSIDTPLDFINMQDTLGQG